MPPLVSKSELARWIAVVLALDGIPKLEDGCTGAMYCLLLSSFFPGHLNLDSIRFDGSMETDYRFNFGLLAQGIMSIRSNVKCGDECKWNGIQESNRKVKENSNFVGNDSNLDSDNERNRDAYRELIDDSLSIEMPVERQEALLRGKFSDHYQLILSMHTCWANRTDKLNNETERKLAKKLVFPNKKTSKVDSFKNEETNESSSREVNILISEPVFSIDSKLVSPKIVMSNHSNNISSKNSPIATPKSLTSVASVKKLEPNQAQPSTVVRKLSKFAFSPPVLKEIEEARKTYNPGHSKSVSALPAAIVESPFDFVSQGANRLARNMSFPVLFKNGNTDTSRKLSLTTNGDNLQNEASELNDKNFQASVNTARLTIPSDTGNFSRDRISPAISISSLSRPSSLGFFPEVDTVAKSSQDDKKYQELCDKYLKLESEMNFALNRLVSILGVVCKDSSVLAVSIQNSLLHSSEFLPPNILPSFASSQAGSQLILSPAPRSGSEANQKRSSPNSFDLNGSV